MNNYMTNLELAQKIVELIGGKDNVLKVANCMTRLRVTLKDESKVNSEELKKTVGILGIVQDGSYIQIVLGPGKAKKVADICIEELKLPKDTLVAGDWKENVMEYNEKIKRDNIKLLGFHHFC